MNLGLAFQIADDVLDYTADADALGKNLGDDLAEGKATLPVIHAMAHASPAERPRLGQIIRDRRHRARCRKCLQPSGPAGSLDYSRRAAERYASAAEASAGLHCRQRVERRAARAGPLRDQTATTERERLSCAANCSAKKLAHHLARCADSSAHGTGSPATSRVSSGSAKQCTAPLKLTNCQSALASCISFSKAAIDSAETNLSSAPLITSTGDLTDAGAGRHRRAQVAVEAGDAGEVGAAAREIQRDRAAEAETDRADAACVQRRASPRRARRSAAWMRARSAARIGVQRRLTPFQPRRDWPGAGPGHRRPPAGSRSPCRRGSSPWPRH